MPQKFKPYTEAQDGRRRLSKEQIEAIRERYKLGGISHRKLGAEYGVSHSYIGQLVNPKRMKRVRDRMKNHWRDYQQKGKEWAKTQKKARDKKRRLGLAYTVSQ